MPNNAKNPFTVLPVAAPQRRMDLVVETVDGETLIYDEQQHKAFCLNRVASAVWRQCDGVRTTTQIAAAATTELGAKVSEEAVLLALEDFRRDNLLKPSATPIPVAMLSRRDLAIKVGVGAALMLPVVAAIVAPRPAHAQTALSGTVQSGPS